MRTAHATVPQELIAMWLYIQSGILACLLIVGWNTAWVEAQTAALLKETLAPTFTPPSPGSYQLPPIDTVTNHTLLDSTGHPIDLFHVTQEKITVVSFIYTSCADVGGCPLAATVLQRVDRMLSERPLLKGNVTLMSISFDPKRDTPEQMAMTRRALGPQTNWLFLTGRDTAAIQPVLDDFNQPVSKLWEADGEWSGLYPPYLEGLSARSPASGAKYLQSGFLESTARHERY